MTIVTDYVITERRVQPVQLCNARISREASDGAPRITEHEKLRQNNEAQQNKKKTSAAACHRTLLIPYTLPPGSAHDTPRPPANTSQKCRRYYRGHLHGTHGVSDPPNRQPALPCLFACFFVCLQHARSCVAILLSYCDNHTQHFLFSLSRAAEGVVIELIIIFICS